MKKFRLIAILSLILCVSCLFCACGGEEKMLSTPDGLKVDQDYRLSWNSVEGALSYKIEVTGLDGNTQTLTSNRAYLSLSSLEQGEYTVRVMAVRGQEKSSWSNAIPFEKAYETGCVYTLINNGTEYEITRYGDAEGTIYIEDTYKGKPVTRIAQRAFKNCASVEVIYMGKNVQSIGDNAFYSSRTLKSVVFPEDSSLTYIGSSAFLGCALLESISLPEGVTEIANSTFAYCRALKALPLHEGVTKIGDYAFSDCSALSKIDIPDSVVSIGDSAFSGCTEATSLNIGAGVQKIPSACFMGCSSLTGVTFSEGGALTQIGQSAFSNCYKLTSVAIPEGVESIERYAFNMQKQETGDQQGVVSLLAAIDLPTTLTSIGIRAFYGTELYNKGIEDQTMPFVYVDDWVISYTMSAMLYLQDIKKTQGEIDSESDRIQASFKEGTVGIADSALIGCLLLETAELPSSIKYIGEKAFASSYKLRYVETPENGLISVGKSAFEDCKILSSVVLGEGLKVIEENAFYGCVRLDSSEGNVLIPDSVERVGQKAFYKTKLWSNPDDFGVVYADDWVVGYAAKLETVDLDKDTVGIADYAFANSDTLRSLVVTSNKLKYIGRSAFYHCGSLDMLDLGATSVREIPDYAFYKCQSLSEIDLPTRLTKIGRSAFYSCLELSKISLSGKRVTEIGKNAFFNCINLESVSFGSELKGVGEAAFYGCAALKEIKLPSSVQTIENHAFYGCVSAQDIELGSALTSIGDYAFAFCQSAKKIDVASTVKEIGNYAFYNAKSAVILKLNEGVERIGDYAFFGAEKISSLSIPASVSHIGEHAFHGCASVQSVILRDSIKEMGEHAFYGCNQLTVYAESKQIAGKWSTRWNSSFRPVVWGCTISEQGSYVVSVESVQNSWAESGLNAPERAGYTLAGWSKTQDGQEEFDRIPTDNAQTLYAVWVERQ